MGKRKAERKEEEERMSKRSSSSSTSTSGKKKVDQAKIESLFAQIADEEDVDVATLDGIVKLGEMLEIDPSADIRILVLLWKMNVSVSKPGEISKTEFVNGMTTLGVEDVAGLKALLPSLDPGFLERPEFRDLYKFVFQFSREGTHKTLEKEMVLGLMPMILDKDRAPHLNFFVDFLQQSKETRITLDQWESFLQFNNTIKVDLSNFEDDGAWPLLLDEYVEWRKKSGNK